MNHLERCLIACLLFVGTFTFAQDSATPGLDYFLPDLEYDDAIPTPASVLGYPIGKWHLTHDQLVHYARQIAEASDRVTLEVIGRTYEDRPQVVLTVTTPDNHEQLESIRQQHAALTDPRADQPDLKALPAVVYQGFTIHGNEPSGSNAVPLLLYHLAAAPEESIADLLDNLVILVDICFNPDGMQRFSTWVNMHKSKTLVSDPNSREFGEVWPRGRTNHYWFDLNRDWLPAQHPESQNRLELFHRWKPNVLTDHHEMGSNSTFFFQPGIPSRTNPRTPAENQILTGKIGEYHARALDAIGSLYYTQESFDDFYYGKGSTYPDINGSIGILFEQASSRGHQQQTINGPLSFPFTIRNQLTTALSTLKASASLRLDLLTYQQQFFAEAMREAKKQDARAYLFTCPQDPARLDAFAKLLRRHQIQLHVLPNDVSTEEGVFPADQSLVVPLRQPQYRLLRAMMEPTLEFPDSLFYDVSTWTLPLAFGLQHTEVEKRSFKSNWLEVPYEQPFQQIKEVKRSNYAYAIRWGQYYAPGAAYALAKEDLRLKVAVEPFTDQQGRTFSRGTLLLPVGIQAKSASEIHELLRKISSEYQVEVEALSTGLTPEGIDLGSPNMDPVRKPQPLLVVGGGVSSYEAGEVWHLFDQRYRIPLPMIEWDDLGRTDLNEYDPIIMVNGYYPGGANPTTEKLKDWVRSGGTLITTKSGTEWAIRNKLAKGKIRKAPPIDTLWESRPYALESKDRGAQYIGGAILSTRADTTHPMLYGVHTDRMPVFLNTRLFLETTKNPYATPLRYEKGDPVLSGYLSSQNRETIPGTAALTVSRSGRGRVIAFNFNPNFRAFWYGTNHLFANALFFGGVISRRTLED